VSGLRGWHRHRRDSLPEHEQYPAEIAGLLHDVQSLRATMASDLSAAAGAVDAERPGVAGDIIEAGRRDLADLARRSPNPDPAGAAVPRPRDHRRTGSHSAVRTVLTATVPLIATAAVAAAAVTAYNLDQRGSRSPGARHQTEPASSPTLGPSQRPAATDAAAATLRALNVAVHHGAAPATIAATAALLHDQLASIAAASAGDSTTLAAVLHMLHAEEHLLAGFPEPGITVELRAVRRLELTLSAPHTAVSHAPSVSSTPSPVSTALPRSPTPAATATRPARKETHPPKKLPATPTAPATSPPPLSIPTIAPVLSGS
jgi:hypothetical protein